MSTSQETRALQLEKHVWEIYSHLYQKYRQGDYEVELECYRYQWPELDNNADYYDYHAPGEDTRATAGKIKYTKAVENLYQLVLFLEKTMGSWVKEHEVKILRIKNLIYEVTDYSLAVPPELGQFFLDQARSFNRHFESKKVEHFADELRRVAGPQPEKDDARVRIIKFQIIAALCGVNYLYRSHMPENYEEALEIVENIEKYVKTDVPPQYKNKRESLGLIGLTMSLKGRLLAAIGDYDTAQRAYAQSIDAYVARLDQKNDFFRNDHITLEEYEEKKTITLRRAALVSALGVGYLAFINSRISNALAALRVARAALRQNVGAVFEAYADILFFACRRAEGSSEKQTIEEAIEGIEACHLTLSKLVPDSHYIHRAGIELAIALHYRVKSDQKAGKVTKRTFEDYDRSMDLLEAAIKQAESVEEGRHENQLTEALFIRSYIRRCLPEITPKRKHSILLNAEKDARRSKESTGNSRMECEALVALGSVQYEQAKYYEVNNKALFRKKLNASRQSFLDALKLNARKNARIEAVCYLKLTKLSLRDPGGAALAHNYFKRWKEIENRVEHAFCHYMAQEINKRLTGGEPLVIINSEASLSHKEWELKLRTKLLDALLIKLSEETAKDPHSEKQLHSLIVKSLRNELKFTKHNAYKITEEHGLVKQLQLLTNNQPEALLNSR